MKNKHLNSLLFIGLLLISQLVSAQRKGYKPDRNQKSNYAYPSPNNFRQGGWLFDAGLTGTFTTKAPEDFLPDGADYTYPFQIRPGLALGLGRYYNLKKGRNIVRYVDATVGYKMLWNAEKQNVETTGAPGVITSTTNDNFAHYASLNFNFNNVISLSNYSFMQNTLGINTDSRFSESVTNETGSTTPSPDAFVAQFHYKLAFGFMVDTDVAVIPYLEIPIFNITPSQSQFSQLDYFHQSFQTITIGVRVMLFKFGQKDCPKAINTDGKARNNGY